MGCPNLEYIQATREITDTSQISAEMIKASMVKAMHPTVSLTYYSNSLDALVPVWGKLGKVCCEFYQQNNNEWGFYFHTSDIFTTRKNLRESACIATAKEIKSLSDR